jgi:hypothetical protein
MSGLREDQREVELLVTLIIGFLPVEPRWCNRWQASSHRICVDSEHSNPTHNQHGVQLPRDLC